MFGKAKLKNSSKSIFVNLDTPIGIVVEYDEDGHPIGVGVSISKGEDFMSFTSEEYDLAPLVAAILDQTVPYYDKYGREVK